MTATFPCPHCRTVVAQGATRCWLCAGPLDPHFVPQGTAVSRDKSWLVVVILASVVLLLIGAQLALIAPGLLVIYAVLALPIAVVLARVAWVGRLDFWRDAAASERAMARPAPAQTAPAATPGGEPYPARLAPAHGLQGIDSGINSGVDDSGTTILKGVAFGVAIFLAILAILVLLFVAAVVVFAIICFASLP